MNKHPMQRIEFDDRGVIRFRANKIIKDLIDSGAIDLNKIALAEYDQADEMQFYQLTGYSVRGYGGLPFVSKDVARLANRRADQLTQQQEERPEEKSPVLTITAKDGRVWTTERPTENGCYWLRLTQVQHQDLTDGYPLAVPVCLQAIVLDGWVHADPLNTTLDIGEPNPWLDGALWSKSDTPADPLDG